MTPVGTGAALGDSGGAKNRTKVMGRFRREVLRLGGSGRQEAPCRTPAGCLESFPAAKAQWSAGGPAVQLVKQSVDIDLVDRSAMLQLLEIRYLAVVAVKPVTLKDGERLGMVSENVTYGHFLGNHVDLPGC